jgi:hypothetical protein
MEKFKAISNVEQIWSPARWPKIFISAFLWLTVKRKNLTQGICKEEESRAHQIQCLWYGILIQCPIANEIWGIWASLYNKIPPLGTIRPRNL